MRSNWFAFILILFVLSVSSAQNDKSGYRVVMQKMEVAEKAVGFRYLTVLAVSPLPPGQYEFEGVDLSPLGKFKDNPRVLHKLAMEYMAKIQNAYIHISGDGEFPKLISRTEPFADGRSSAIAIFEGENAELSMARATLRISYANEKNDWRLPFLNTLEYLGIREHRSEFYPLQPIRSVTPGNLPVNLLQASHGPILRWIEKEALAIHPDADASELFLPLQDALQRLTSQPIELKPGQTVADVQSMLQAEADRIMKNFEQTFDPLRIMAMHARGSSDPNVKMNEKVASNDGHVLFEKYLRTHDVKMGGAPAEIKGLGHRTGESKAEFLWAVYTSAVANGFFDYIPARLGIPVPTHFVAASTAVKAQKVFPDVGIEIMKEFEIPGNGRSVIFQVDRTQLSEGINDYLIRTALVLADEEFPRYERMKSKFSAEKLRARAAVLNIKEVKGYKYSVELPLYLEQIRCGPILGGS